jgi:DNA-binding CsgD family transcriptional regulator
VILGRAQWFVDIRLGVRFVPDAALQEIQAVKLRQLADEAGLSVRERSVFECLLLGRTLVDVAMLLNISRHTVKFHQSNILRKLGADSRIDIVRLIGF